MLTEGGIKTVDFGDRFNVHNLSMQVEIEAIPKG